MRAGWQRQPLAVLLSFSQSVFASLPHPLVLLLLFIFPLLCVSIGLTHIVSLSQGLLFPLFLFRSSSHVHHVDEDLVGAVGLGRITPFIEKKKNSRKVKKMKESAP